MITNYNKFINQQINEGIFSSLKKMFVSLVSNINDNMKKGIEDLDKALDITKGDQKKIKELYKDYINKLKTELSTEMKNSDLKNTKKVISDTVKSLYTTINSVIKYADNSNLTLAIVFNNLPTQTKKQFTLDNKTFEKNADLYVNSLIKGYFNLETKFTDDELGLNDKIETKEPTKTEVKPEEQQAQVDKAAGTEQQNANTHYNYNEYLFEAENTNSGTTIDPKKLQQYKDKVVKWFNQTCDQILNNVVNSKTNTNTTSVISNDTLKMFNNKDGAKRIATRAVSAQKDQETTKKKFRDIRDALIKGGYGNKEEYGDL